MLIYVLGILASIFVWFVVNFFYGYITEKGRNKTEKEKKSSEWNSQLNDEQKIFLNELKKHGKGLFVLIPSYGGCPIYIKKENGDFIEIYNEKKDPRILLKSLGEYGRIVYESEKSFYITEKAMKDK